ncbi:hypothetical protein G3V73_24190, partial [Escherichia coli]|nr:hypothetical protein [Escherichia coli]
VYGFVSTRHRQKDFLEYFGRIVESKRTNSKGNYTIWRATQRHLKAFSDNRCRFADLTEQFCIDFKDFLSDNKELAKSSASSYFDKFKNAVQQAFENNLLSYNPIKKIKSIKFTHTQREFLTYDELRLLAKT